MKTIGTRAGGKSGQSVHARERAHTAPVPLCTSRKVRTRARAGSHVHDAEPDVRPARCEQPALESPDGRRVTLHLVILFPAIGEGDAEIGHVAANELPTHAKLDGHLWLPVAHLAGGLAQVERLGVAGFSGGMVAAAGVGGRACAVLGAWTEAVRRRHQAARSRSPASVVAMHRGG